jgi:hypothetical protein
MDQYYIYVYRFLDSIGRHDVTFAFMQVSYPDIEHAYPDMAYLIRVGRQPMRTSSLWRPCIYFIYICCSSTSL